MTMTGVARAELPKDLTNDWYRVELLVFLREDDGAFAAEAWEPLPELAYPDRYRHLIDPELADRRLRESDAYTSVIDERGAQQLLLPALFSTIEEASRPDARINEPYEEPEPSPLLDGSEDSPVLDDEGAAADSSGLTDLNYFNAAPATTDEDSENAAIDAPMPRLRVLAYQLLGDDALDFASQARSLRRRGERILFHGAWWQHLPEGHTPEALALDRGADSDVSPWPELQGSVLIYRSRYLHIDVDLWLNTLATYLPEGWQIDAPPLPLATLSGETLAGEAYDPWAPQTLYPDLPLPDEGEDPIPGSGTTSRLLKESGPVTEAAMVRAGAAEGRDGRASPAIDPETVSEQASALEDGADAGAGNDSGMEPDSAMQPPYPWRHAIAHRQSRRMRSDEIHYLDHPLIGVVVRLRPASEELPPLVDDEDKERDFRERHALPLDEVLIDDPSTDGE